MQANWHPDCFLCEICGDGLADAGFVKNAGRLVFSDRIGILPLCGKKLKIMQKF